MKPGETLSYKPEETIILTGTKKDADKPDLSLLDPLFVMGVGRVMTFGKKKYAAWNWKQGLHVGRCLAAALRHIFQFLSGEDLDPESGECHLYHAACSVQFAAVMWETRKDLDDRYKEAFASPLKALEHHMAIGAAWAKKRGILHFWLNTYAVGSATFHETKEDADRSIFAHRSDCVEMKL